MDLDELVEHWTLLDDEQALIAGKRGSTRLGFALLLKGGVALTDRWTCWIAHVLLFMIVLPPSTMRPARRFLKAAPTMRTGSMPKWL